MFNLKNTVCRTCLETVAETDSINIFITQDLSKKLLSCTGQPFESSDEYPEQLCQKCYSNVVKFYDFQQMCYKSLETFLDLLKAEQIRGGNNICGHYAGGDLKDVEDKNRLSIAVIEESNSSQIISQALARNRSRKTSNKFEDQKLKRAAVIKNSKSKELKQETKNDLEEYLQFGTEDKAGDSSDSQECLKEQEEVNIEFEDPQAVEGDIGQQPVEEIILTDVLSSEPVQELVCIEKQKHVCHLCSFESKTLLNLQVHLRQHDGLPPYFCSFKGCTRSFDLWDSYKKHVKVHNASEQVFKCDLENCERSYKNMSNLNVHKRKFHNFGPELKTHMCEVCGKVYKSSAVLNDHRFTHIDKTQLPYVCEELECAKRFSTKEKLRIHKMRHDGIKNFVCPHCGMRKTTRNELRTHINYHTLERTWPCRFCPKICNSAGNLKMHIKNIHEGAKDFACRYCQRTFAKADTRKYHEMTHTGEKPNECKECGRRFI